jgi:hypothetical protein
MARDRNRPPEAVRITTAASDRNADIAMRQRRYLLSMSLRSFCFVSAIVAALAGIDWLWPILIFGALILPYIAVVMANAVATRTDSFDLADTVYRRELEGPSSRPLGDGRDRV